MADAELTNWKCGIDAVWGVGDGSDKGTAYQEEYWFFDKPVWDVKSVYLKADTDIRLSHNARNTASINNSRNKTLIGANGLDGIANSGDEGTIRYKIDRYRKFISYTSSGGMPAYTAPIALQNLSYETGVPVVGTTGGRPGFAETSNDFYQRGLVDEFGDEWHVLFYWHDDTNLGTTTAGNSDSACSDGKYVLLCVNPKTPCLTVRASGSGQFYTTPLWTYWIPKLHTQTTYFTGTCTFELRDINGNNVFYRINGGSFTNAGANNVTLDQDDFSDGTNTLEYYFAGNSAFTKTRTVVKNPTHPGAAETHGDRLWSEAEWSQVASKASRSPFSARITNWQTADGAGHTNWSSRYRSGQKFGGQNWLSSFRPGSPTVNAFQARRLGWTATRTGDSKTYATYAKEACLDSALNNPPVGFENQFWASIPMPCAETVYRGYWDASFAAGVAVGYDLLMSGYRSDQVSGGITPVEDYFIRDRMASWVHLCAWRLGMNGSSDNGMWSACWNVAATMISAVMPNYSTAYYGTCGLDGNTTVYEWAPYKTTNYTWKQLFIEESYTIGTYPNAPTKIYAMQGNQFTDAIIHPPGTTIAIDNLERIWADRLPYTSFSQCGQWIYLYAHMQRLYDPDRPKVNVDHYIQQVTVGPSGNVRAQKPESGGNYSAVRRNHAIFCLNQRFPDAAANATAWAQSLASNDENSDDAGLLDGGPLAYVLYDDTYFGSVAAPAFTTQPQSTSVTAGLPVTFTVVVTGVPSPTLQWRKDGVNISGATSSSYTINAVQMSDAANYDCVATNSQGTVTSNAAALTVTPDEPDPEPPPPEQSRYFRGKRTRSRLGIVE